MDRWPEDLADTLDRVASEVLDAYRRLGGSDGPANVAVRSSAAGEDSGEASFAGMNETFTNVRGDRELLDRLRACWRSVYGDRVVSYRATRRLEAEPAIAVVVQRMLDVDRSGVMFTTDPTVENYVNGWDALGNPFTLFLVNSAIISIGCIVGNLVSGNGDCSAPDRL